jgi:hypothetical protein
VRYETGAIVYQWTVDNGATIISGQGTDTITVQTEGNADTTFNVTLFVKDDLDDSMMRRSTSLFIFHIEITPEVSL